MICFFNSLCKTKETKRSKRILYCKCELQSLKHLFKEIQAFVNNFPISFERFSYCHNSSLMSLIPRTVQIISRKLIKVSTLV